MHDIKAIRQDPAAFDKAMARRGLESQSPAILKLDEDRRAVQTELQTLQNERNEKSKQIGALKSKGGDASQLMEDVNLIKDKMTGLEVQEKELAIQLNDILSSLPNVQAPDIPDGGGEEENVEIRKVGEPKRLNEKIPEHSDIGEALGMMDFETAAKMSGSRFVIMHSGLARLERALAQFMLDTHTGDHGYTEVSPPLMVKDNALYGTGQLPKFEDDLFQTSKIDKEAFELWFIEEVKKDYAIIKSETAGLNDHDANIKITPLVTENNKKYGDALNNKFNQKYWLIPTSEVSLTNMVADAIVEEEKLPYRFTAHTPCFRSEAGSAGKDTKGMIRQHQFYKVEMVSITKPEDSEAEHERMTKCAETILQKLELPYRTIVLCTGDAGFSSYKTYDIEVWLPGQGRYREISSCSNCGDFQARRMNARCRAKGEKNTRFVHTLNGSGVAVGRALIAVLENCYDPADGGVFVPEVLKPYMGGTAKILPLQGKKTESKSEA